MSVMSEFWNDVPRERLCGGVNSLACRYKLFVDNGASDPYRGSFKVKIISDIDNRTLLTVDDLPESLKSIAPPRGFIDTDDYIECMINNIVESIKLAMPSIDEEKEKLTGICINVPAYVINNNAGIIANLRNKHDVILSDVDYNRILPGLKANNVDLDENNFRLLAINDLAGAAAGVALRLATDEVYRGILTEGFYGTVCMTGGGTGIVDIKYKKGILEVELSESGHLRSFNSDYPTSMERYGSSTSALIKHYSKYLDLLPEEVDKLLSIGKGKIASQYPFKVIAGSDAENIVMSTGLFGKIGEDYNRTGVLCSLLQLKDITKKEHRKASKYATEFYIDALAQLASVKILEGCNYFILTGPMFTRIKERLDKDITKVWEGKSFEVLFTEAVLQYLDDSGLNVMNQHKFSIITDIHVDDNTVGGAILLNEKTEFIGTQVRGNWFNIPAEILV